MRALLLCLSACVATDRPYEAVVPHTIDPTKRYPLFVVLHGHGGSGPRVRRYYGLDPLVDEMGVLVAYPNGTYEKPPHWWQFFPRRRFWNATDICCNFYGEQVDDVAYLDSVIDDMSAKYPVDPKRIFVGGISNGGYMSYRYACDRASRVAAIMVQAGVMYTDATRCKPSEPVAVLHAHGTEDETLPYAGGLVMGQGPDVKSAHASVGDWVTFDGCSPAPAVNDTLDLVVDAPGAETTKEQWQGCRGVELWTMRGAVHAPRLQRPGWGRAILGWLLAHPKP